MILSFSPPIRRGIALGLLLLSLLVLATFVIGPLVSLSTGALERLKDAQFEHQRLTLLAAAPPDNRADLMHRRQQLTEMVMVAPDASQATAILQSRLVDIFQKHRLTIASTRTAPQADAAALSLVAVNIDATGPERAWLDTLEAIEAARPLLLVRRLEITAPQTDAPDRQLRGQITVAGVWIQPQEAR